MAKKIFVSFDYENDKHYKFLLQAWNKNNKFEFTFEDHSSQEIDSDNIARVKAALSRKIDSADVTLVIVGKEANKKHPDSEKIGFKNWINFEVVKSIELEKSLVAVKLKSDYESPEELLGSGASWAMSFTEENIMNALSKA
jgi:hypothetical protein